MGMTGKRAEPELKSATGQPQPDSVRQTELIEVMVLLVGSPYQSEEWLRLTALVLMLKVAESAVVARAQRSGLPAA